ncbi:putative metal-binding motif-containing protein [Myxococcus faecalis]|uniref:putative metal-binding motif-containing protein n=1 Tax=Myxococcus faecalis TaxID=3115646 RepID=UPI003CEC48AC
MRRIALFLFPLLLLACSKEKERAGTSLVVNYTPSFKKGCFVIKVNDVGDSGDGRESKTISELTGEGKLEGKLRVGLIRKDEWPAKVKVTVTAHEKDCSGAVVNTRTIEEVDLGEEGVAKDSPYEVTLVTPDDDEDGFVAKADVGTPGAPGGTDCNDDKAQRGAAMYPGNEEVCDQIDNNCVNGVDEGFPVMTIFRDGDGDGVGGARFERCMPATGYVTVGGDCDDDDPVRAPNKPELCDDVDNNCNNVVDEGIDKNWYQDRDGDGAVELASRKIQCEQPDGYIRKPQDVDFDCDDDDPNNTPGKLERCDNADNNCNGVADERFTTKNTPCNNLSCTGMWVCKSDFSDVECTAKPPRMFYRDRDGDGDGDRAVGALDEICEGETPSPGYVETAHGDCDDKDPARSSLLPEVCDAIDNDCDADEAVDEGLSCNGTLKDVVDYHTGGDSHDWRTVSTGPNGYPVWIAGRGGKLAVRKTATSKFESFSHGDGTGATPDGSPPAKPGDGCTDRNWTASWVASYGHVFLAGEGGIVAIHDGSTCVGTPGSISTANLTGIVGFETPPATTTLYITDTDGRLIRWVVGGTPAFTTLHDNTINYYGIHGLTASALLVAGRSTGSDAGQEFVSYTNEVPSSLHTTLPDNASGFANAVWMGRANKACAVGDGGLAWRWNGATIWTQAEASGTNVDFSSVVMRYDAQNPANPLNDQCYIVDKGAAGKLRRLTPYGWASPMTLLPANRANVPLRDIALTASGDIWIVGDDGRVFHYPEPTTP